MRKTARSSGLAAAVILAFGMPLEAFASHLGTKSATCRLKECTYAITVESCDAEGIHPDYEYIFVDKGAHVLKWVIITPGYKFPPQGTSGIKFTKPAGPAEISGATRISDTEFSVKDSNPQGKKKVLKYDIDIVNGAGTHCVYDPSVVNE